MRISPIGIAKNSKNRNFQEDSKVFRGFQEISRWVLKRFQCDPRLIKWLLGVSEKFPDILEGVAGFQENFRGFEG